jgi:FHS family Na+ dependent glucose MFS transporter 1
MKLPRATMIISLGFPWTLHSSLTVMLRLLTRRATLLRPRHALRARPVCTTPGGGLPDPPAHSPPSPASSPALLPFCAAFAAFGLAGGTLGPTLPRLAAQLSLTPSDLSPVLVATALGGLTGAFSAQHLPSALLVPAGLCAMAASYAALPHTGSLLTLGLGYAVASAAAQLVAVGGNSQLARGDADGKGASMRLSAANALFGLGSLLAPTLHEQLAHFPLSASYGVVSAALLTSALPFMRSSEPQRGRKAATAPSDDLLAKRAFVHPSRAFAPCVLLLVACVAGAEVSLGSWVYSHALSIGLPSTAAASALTAFWGGLVLYHLKSLIPA